MDAFSKATGRPRGGRRPADGEGDKAFCSGGDQKVRGDGGYVGDDAIPGSTSSTCSGRSARCPSR